MSNEHQLRLFEATQAAVRDYARTEFQSLTRKAIHRLQRIPASDIFGDEYAYKSLWDEYCHEVQQGPHEILDYAWNQTLEPIMQDIVDRIPKHSAALLSISAAIDFGEVEDLTVIGAAWPDVMKRLLGRQLSELAGFRNLDHLGPQ